MILAAVRPVTDMVTEIPMAIIMVTVTVMATVIMEVNMPKAIILLKQRKSLNRFWQGFWVRNNKL